MQTVKILHLFPRLMSLYGDYGNLQILKKYAADFGCAVQIVLYEGGELRPEAYDTIYVGAGTEQAIALAARELAPYRETITAHIENGGLWLCTGTSLSLFGKSITGQGAPVETLGVFDFTTAAEPEKRYSGDVLTTDNNPFGAPLVGYINNCYTYVGKLHPLCGLRLGQTLGNDKKTPPEGHVYKSFYATALTGPLLAKNPAALAFFLKKLTGKDCRIPPEAMVNKAYASALAELQARV